MFGFGVTVVPAGGQGYVPACWWSRLRTSLLVVKVTYQPAGGQGYVPACWWSRLRTSLLVVKVTYPPSGFEVCSLAATDDLFVVFVCLYACLFVCLILSDSIICWHVLCVQC